MASSREQLPAIPRPADLAGDRLVHHFRDYFNPPQAQNELGFLQATKSVSAITDITLPPFSCGGQPSIRFSPGNLITCELFLNGQILTNYPPPAGEIAYTWCPHRFRRETQAEGLLFTTDTFLLSKQRVVAESIEVRSISGELRKVTLGFDLRAGVTKRAEWPDYTPAEVDNRLTSIDSLGCIVFEAIHSRAVSVQGILPAPSRIENRRMVVHEFTIQPGETRTFRYLNVIGDEAKATLETYRKLQRSFNTLLAANEQHFANLIESAFTPENQHFSGHLPQLHTKDPSLWKLYYTGFANLLLSRRISPASVCGPTYITAARIAPTRSYPWDISLTALSLSLLDPQIVRSLIETWLTNDMHQHQSTDYLTGRGVGCWYAANDLAILRCADSYLRVTGDFGWLDQRIAGKAVLEHLMDHALYWKRLVRDDCGLADYGLLQNLLECVSTYLHEVAAINAGNVYGMRFVATLLERRGDSSEAAHLRVEAKQLAERINRLLYVPGKGWWRCGQPDGTYNQVRHCYDLLTILDTMAEDLSNRQKEEMRRFFWKELHTPLWMHALSPGDTNATWGMRPDHGWLGAYPAWPAMTAKGLYRIESSPRVAAWVKGLATAANQGPFGQAHFVESVFLPEKGGALKCPYDLPYGCDWGEIVGGSFTDLVIDSIFGTELTLYDGVHVHSRLTNFDAGAELHHLNYHGKAYIISRNGAATV